MGDYGKGSGPPHFDGKNYPMWERRMGAFLRGKGTLIWEVTQNPHYVIPDSFLLPGSRDMFEANSKAVDYLFRALCASEFDRVYGEDVAGKIWLKLKNAHVGNAQVQARMFSTYRR